MGEMVGVSAGSTPSVTSLAQGASWDLEAAKSIVLAAKEGFDLDGSIKSYQVWLGRGLRDYEPGLDGKRTEGVRNALKPIGIKVDPKMEPEICAAWLSVMAMALRDLPPRVIIEAAEEAILTPIRFLNEVDGIIRKEAEKIMVRHRLAILRMLELKRALGQASRPALTADPIKPTREDYMKAGRGELGRALLRMGNKAGMIPDDIYVEAMSQGEKTGEE